MSKHKIEVKDLILTDETNRDFSNRSLSTTKSTVYFSPTAYDSHLIPETIMSFKCHIFLLLLVAHVDSIINAVNTETNRSLSSKD